MPSPRVSRLRSRAAILPRALRALAVSARRRKRPADARRILVAHSLLLGDTLMLTPLLAKLRERFPAAEIVMTASPAIAPLYASRPYGVRAVVFDPRADPARLFAETEFDLALVPGDNRYSWLAAALRARWIVGFAGDRPAYKSWPVDEARAYPDRPMAWGDMVAGLVDGPAPQPYRTRDWPQPPHKGFDLPADGFCVLHVGASSPLKRWGADRWRALAERLGERGLQAVWSAGPGEEAIVRKADPERHYRSYAGALDLAQLWQLLARASLLVCPDTGIAHLARIVGTPAATLFGPGSALLCGAGSFWREAAYLPVTVADFPCRDQKLLFKREIHWVRRCARGIDQCASPRCMEAIALERVLAACDELLRAPRDPATQSAAGRGAGR